ncbi:MAG: ABC transporter substrate-binding protein [Phycisphaeraceae bacterium]|nr:ABC transporter substrate-binding protein [Phycisphaeraceae bacterium]
MTPTQRHTLTLAHSPDPDDVFMWWPITGKIDPVRKDEHGFGVVVEPPRLDTGRFAFRAMAEDIAVLNRRAIVVGDLDITALSMFTWAHVSERYQLTACGSSMGEGYGPKVVCRRGEGGRPARTIAIPGIRTTAFLLWRLWEEMREATPDLGARGEPEIVELPFDQILAVVSAGRADRGLLIHQSQLTYASLGLEQIVDLGQWWGERTGLPLPLGGNAVRRDLDARCGPGTIGEVVALLDLSVQFALRQRDESVRYCMQFAPEIDRAQAERYIDMYVSPLTVDMGPRGEAALRRLLDEAARLGLAPAVGTIDIARAHR